MRLVAFCVFGLWIVMIGSLARGQSCTGYYYSSNSGDLITFSAGSGVTSSQIQNAINQWTVCTTMGAGFPDLAMSGSGIFNITVMREPGVSTTSSGGCGVFNHDLNSSSQVIGGTIVLFDADILGHDCEPKWEGVIAHEIGHVLGLADSGCSDHIMGSGPGRSVRSAECTAVDNHWVTDSEVTPPEDNPEEPPQCPTSPILVDLDLNGFHLDGVRGAVRFDIDGDGVSEAISWTRQGAGDAFLALDRNGNGAIDDGSELFGSATVLSNGTIAENGYVALAEFDLPGNGGDGDGTISASDRIWQRLLVWTDRNHNAKADARELQAIGESGLIAMVCKYRESGRKDRHGNEFRYRAKARMRQRGGPERTVLTYDVFFVMVR